MKFTRLSHFLSLLCCVTVFFVTPQFATQAVAEEPANASGPAPVTAGGVFMSTKSTEVSCDNEHLTSLELERIVPHGASVTKGQPIVWFESDDWDKKVREEETALQLARISLHGEEFAFEQFMRTQEMDREAAERKRDHARQDHDHFLKQEYPRQIAQAKQSLKSSEFSLESTTEEFEQLSQMYEEDDLTEQSEEIVLRRAKFAMESAQFRHEGTKASVARSLEETLPRQKHAKEVALERAMMEHEKAIHEMNLAREKREIEIGKAREKFEEQERKFDELVEERSSVVLEATHDGIFLYGKLSRGKMSAKPVDYQSGTKVTAGQVIGTIVKITNPTVHVELPEKHVGTVTIGKQCIVTSPAYPTLKLKGRVKSVSKVAFAAGKHDCVISLRGQVDAPVVPTMACEVTFDELSKRAGRRGKKKQSKKEATNGKESVEPTAEDAVETKETKKAVQ